MIVDLRSDTVTLPSKDMLEFMMSSNVGDDVYGEDPTVNLLQSKVAAIFGKEVGMFFPSGTMANQTAIKLHTNPGEQVICDKYSHIYNYEGGGASFNSGVSFKLINGERGMFTSEQAANSINPKDFYHSPLTQPSASAPASVGEGRSERKAAGPSSSRPPTACAPQRNRSEEARTEPSRAGAEGKSAPTRPDSA